MEGILEDKQHKLASKLSCLGYSELIDNIFDDIFDDDDILNLFEDAIKINKEIEQCKFVLENENSAPC